MEYERVKLDTACFFWGSLSDAQAAYLLLDALEGTYIAREIQRQSTNEREFDIVVKIRGAITILPVLRQHGLLSLDFGDDRQPTAVTLYCLIQKLVQKTKVDAAVFTLVDHGGLKIPVQIIEPCKRISSLKAHCRRAVRMKYAVKEIETLLLPKAMKKYLMAI